MAKIFISYSRKDIDIAKELKERLEALLFEVWLDTEDIFSGDQWRERILAGIEACSAFVIIVTPRAARSHWVMRELTYAIEFGKPIFPFLLEGDLFPLISDFQSAQSIEALIRGLARLTQIFVCHAPEDAEFASRLKADLSSLGATLWQGANTDPQALSSSQIMLVIVTPDSMGSREIREQISAFDTPSKTIIPLVAQQHTPVISKLRDHQPYVDFLQQDYQIALAQVYGLLKMLGVNLKEHAAVAIPSQPPLPLSRTDLVLTAKETVWISGLVVSVFSRYPSLLPTSLKHNPRLEVRILTLALNVQLANETGGWVGLNERVAKVLPPDPEFEAWAANQGTSLTPEGRWIAQRLFRNQKSLESIQAQFRDRLMIRTVSHRLALGHFIVDAHAGASSGMLTVSPYFYQIDRIVPTRPSQYNTSPIFLSRSSSKESDLWWFDQYVQEFERLWEWAAPWVSS